MESQTPIQSPSKQVSFLLKNQRLILFLSIFSLALLIAIPFSLRFSTNPLTVLMNLILLFPLFSFFLMLTRRPPLSFLLTSLPFLFLSYIDAVVYKSRLIHLRYIDFLTANDGLRVASRYNLAPPFRIFLLLSLIIALTLTLFFLSHTLKEKHSSLPSKTETLLIGLSLFICSLLFLFVGTKSNLLFIPYESVSLIFDVNRTTERAGLIYALYGEYLESQSTPPDNYSDAAAKEILSRHSNPSAVDINSKIPSTNQTSASSAYDSTTEPIDLIVIMNESLADYSLIGTPNFQNDPLKNIHNQDNHYFEGKLIVPVYGGGTSNTEFEFLTGNSMFFLPPAASPFSQYITKEIPSLASDLNTLGFRTIGMHPYYSEEWNRKTVYPNLGFKETIFGENFSSGLEANTALFSNSTSMLEPLRFGDNLEYIRGLISDAECYRKILSLLHSPTDPSTEKTSTFLFAVTIQNHGNYDHSKDEFTNTPYLEASSTMNQALTDMANQYLTLSSLSDEAFHNFIQELSQHKKRTLVLMFGDHQPALETANLVSDFQDGAFDYYITPYIVWSNFDLAFSFPKITSTNYLSALLKQSADLPLTAWDNFRLSTRSNFPVINSYFALDNAGSLLKKPSTLTNSSPSLSSPLSDYSILTYYNLFSSAQ